MPSAAFGTGPALPQTALSTNKSGLNTEWRIACAGCATGVAVPAPSIPSLRVLNARSTSVLQVYTLLYLENSHLSMSVIQCLHQALAAQCFPTTIAYITVRKVYSLGMDNVTERDILCLSAEKISRLSGGQLVFFKPWGEHPSASVTPWCYRANILHTAK